MTDVERLEQRLEREREARAQAERIAESATRVLYDRQRELELLQTVASAANSSETGDMALQAAVDSVCAHTGWPVGHAYLRDGDCLLDIDVWCAGNPELTEHFRSSTREMRFERGLGLPGRVLDTGEPAWITEVGDDPGFLRSSVAQEAGLHAAFAFPVLVGSEVGAVLEFFHPTSVEPDLDLLSVMTQVGSIAGRALERTRARTDLERMAEELRERNRELEQSNSDLERFAYIASHDLTEPLRTVSSFVSLLARRYEGKLDADADEFIGYALDGTKRMQQLIQDLLAYSRAGRMADAEGRVDVAGLLEVVRRDLAGPLEQAGATLEVVPPLPVVRGDHSALAQVLQNLCANALKFRREEGTPVVRIHGEAAAAEGTCEIWVSDNGIGIPHQYRDQVFEMFRRLHTREAYPGTGIGLAVCQRIVERLGGRIRAEDGIDGGTAIVVTLPAAA
jgi:signal transduction histidine kinase